MSTPTKSERGPQWSNSYEAQLSDADLHWLHSSLLARKPSDKAIREKLPPWKSGPRTGQQVSLATLSNIRDRLELEEDLRGAEQTTETILEELKREDPSLSQEKLDAFGLKTFTTLAIQRRDVKAFVSLQRSRKEREALELDKSRYRRETCELFLQWAADQRAKDIAAGPTSNAEKIEQLGALMFGDDWNPKREAKPA
jgi:hypothetical protein